MLFYSSVFLSRYFILFLFWIFHFRLSRPVHHRRLDTEEKAEYRAAHFHPCVIYRICPFRIPSVFFHAL